MDIENFATSYQSSNGSAKVVARRRSTTLTVPLSADSCYHSDRQALPSARCSRAGILATAATCMIRDAPDSDPFTMASSNQPATDWPMKNVQTLSSFYRAMLCIRGTSHPGLCLSVSVRLCPSVTSRSSTKTAKRRITQITPHDSPGSLVFCCQRSPRNSTGVTPYEGAECRWGG